MTLNSLRGIKRASAPAFLYTLIMNRVKESEKDIWGKIAAVITIPTTALLIVLFILIGDTEVILRNNKSGNSMNIQSIHAMYQEEVELAVNFYDYE